MSKKIKEKIKSFFSSPVFFILLAGFLVRLFLYKSATYHLDVNTFIAWSKTLADGGLPSFYQNAWSDYLPGYLYVLWILGKIKDLVVIDQLFLYKLPAIISDLATGYLIFLIVKKLKNQRLALVSSTLYVLNPAIISNSTLWGQVDSLTALFSLLSVYLVSVNWVASAISLAIGSVIKPQAAIAAVVVLFVMLKEKWRILDITKYVLLSFVTTVLLFLPFSGGGDIFVFIYERIAKTLGQYPYSSVNAFSFWGLGGFWKSDTGGFFPARLVGNIVFAFIFILSSIKLWARKNSRYLLLAIAFAANFLFFTRMHERHLLPLFAPLAIASSVNASLWIPYVGFSATYVANLYYAYGAITGSFDAFSKEVIILIILFNLGLLIYLLYSLFVEKTKLNFKKYYKELKKTAQKKGRIANFLKKNGKVILVAILAFSFVARIAFLWSPPNEYFDEVYHAFTAKRMLNNDPKAWEWWNDPPEGFAYEWTHPPVAKLGMASGMYVFGESSFGWRIPGAILGTISVFLVYLISKELFDDEVVGLLSSAAFSISGLALVMSRIGMNDIYLLTFSLLSLYLFIKDKNFFSGISFGLAVASKWSAVWLLPILFVGHFVLKKKIKISHVWFLIIPPLVYLASYIPMFLTGHGFDIFIGTQKQMWWYHTRLEAEHAYTSFWWTWPFLIRPIWLYTSGKVNGMIANIYAMGNPLFFWGGLVSLVISAIYSFFEKNKKLGFVLFSYLVFFVPWAMSPRIMFLYHYLPSLPFLAILIGWVLRRHQKLIAPFFAVSLILFVYLFPHLSGIKVPVWLDSSYYWFSSWK